MKMICIPGRLRRRVALRIGAALASGAIVLGAGAGASAATVYNPGHVPDDAMRRIVEACGVVARLPNGSAYDLYVCEESLSRSLAARLASGPAPQMTSTPLATGPQADRRERERRACVAIGFDAAGAGLAQCVADLDAELWAADRPIM